MKRLTIALLTTAALTSSAWAITPTEREMNDFSKVSVPKYTHEAAPTASEGMPAHSYNKAVGEHKKEHKHHTAHGKQAAKPHHKKHHDTKPAAAKPAQ